MEQPMFGTRHILMLCISIILILTVTVILKKKQPKLRHVNKALLYVGIISELVKVLCYTVVNEEKFGGYLPKSDLPFHLCSVQILFFLILNLTSKEQVKRVLYAFMFPTCLIGGFAALLLPTHSARNMWVITGQYFLYHTAIIIFALYLIITKELRFSVKDYLNALKMLLLFFFVSVYLNSWVSDYVQDINFMYVIKPPMDGLPFLNKDNGWLSYIFRYACLAVVCVTACYIRPIVSAIRNGKCEAGGESATKTGEQETGCSD